MNIFKSLRQGNGRITETNITSFLSYLLNSTNELDNSFVVLFFELIDKNLTSNKLGHLLRLKQETLRERITHFSRHFSVTAVPEFAFTKEGRKQIVDVFLKILTKNDEKDIAYLLIENKINIGAINKEQASKQYEYFIATDEYQAGVPVYTLVLTSDFDAFQSMYFSAQSTNTNSVWIRWTSKKDKDNTIESILRELLISEQHALIEPINPNTQFILKSFVDYIATEYSNTYTGERNYNFNGSNEVECAGVLVRGTNYKLRRYENKMIRVFDSNEDLVEIEVLPLLKEINRQYSLGVDIKHSTGTAKNTQVFGREVISALNKKQLN